MERRYRILVIRGESEHDHPNSPMDKNQGEKKRSSSGLAMGVRGGSRADRGERGGGHARAGRGREARPGGGEA